MSATPNVITPRQYIATRLRVLEAEVDEELERWPDDGTLPTSQVRVFLLRTRELLRERIAELLEHPDA